MLEKDFPIKRTKQLLEERGWSYYKLAKEANMPLSTLRNIFRNETQPSIVTTSQICDGLGISMSQFFSIENDEPVYLNEDQKCVLDKYNLLTHHQKEILNLILEGMIDKQN